VYHGFELILSHLYHDHSEFCYGYNTVFRTYYITSRHIVYQIYADLIGQQTRYCYTTQMLLCRLQIKLGQWWNDASWDMSIRLWLIFIQERVYIRPCYHLHHTFCPAGRQQGWYLLKKVFNIYYFFTVSRYWTIEISNRLNNMTIILRLLSFYCSAVFVFVVVHFVCNISGIYIP
jgi:hypothetical protein